MFGQAKLRRGRDIPPPKTRVRAPTTVGKLSGRQHHLDGLIFKLFNTEESIDVYVAQPILADEE